MTTKDLINPIHVGVIMDGNGRWAQLRGLPRIAGHHAGVRSLEKAIRAAKNLGIKYFSVYAFSTENWGRPQSEVLGLMSLFKYYVKTKLSELNSEGVRVRFAGDLKNLPSDVLAVLLEAEAKTQSNNVIQLIVCFNYGGRKEILDAVNKILSENKGSEITFEDIEKNLYLPDVPNPDLLIRTGGELRMSNFWLWQGAYSEYYFTEKYWPDFEEEDLKQALAEYARRDRRYGKV